YLTGDLGGLHGTLNVDAGTGHNSLQVSDEDVAGGKSGILLTDNKATAVATDPNLATVAQQYLLHLAGVGISYRVTAGGNFGGGITIWTGYGDDSVTVDAVHDTPGVRETTTL